MRGCVGIDINNDFIITITLFDMMVMMTMMMTRGHAVVETMIMTIAMIRFVVVDSFSFSLLLA